MDVPFFVGRQRLHPNFKCVAVDAEFSGALATKPPSSPHECIHKFVDGDHSASDGDVNGALFPAVGVLEQVVSSVGDVVKFVRKGASSAVLIEGAA